MNNKLVFNSALLFAEKFVVLALSFINTLVIARYAGIALFGEFSLIIATASLFLPFTVLGLNNICNKYFIKYPKNAHHYLKASLIPKAIIALLTVPLAYVCSLLYLDKNTANLIALAVLLQWFNVFTIIEFYYLAKQHTLKPTLIRVSAKLVAKLALLAAVLYQLPIVYWVIIIGFEYLVISLGYIRLYKQDKAYLNTCNRSLTPTCKRLISKSKWLFLSSIAAVLYLKIDQVMLGIMLSKEDVAYYAAAAKLSEFWYVFPVLIANVFMPKLATLYQSNRLGYWQLQRKIIFVLSVSAVCLIVLTYVAAPKIITSLFGTLYLPSIVILQIHILGCLFIFSRAFISKWLILSSNYPYSLYSHGLGAIVNIVLNLLLIPSMGGVGAAIASVVAYFVASAGFLVLFKNTRYFLFMLSKAYRHV